MKNTVTISVRAVGVKEAVSKVSQLRRSIDQFFTLGKKHGIPRKTLVKLLAFQVENMDKPKLDLDKLPAIEYK